MFLLHKYYRADIATPLIPNTKQYLYIVPEHSGHDPTGEARLAAGDGLRHQHLQKFRDLIPHTNYKNMEEKYSNYYLRYILLQGFTYCRYL